MFHLAIQNVSLFCLQVVTNRQTVVWLIRSPPETRDPAHTWQPTIETNERSINSNFFILGHNSFESRNSDLLRFHWCATHYRKFHYVVLSTRWYLASISTRRRILGWWHGIFLLLNMPLFKSNHQPSMQEDISCPKRSGWYPRWNSSLGKCWSDDGNMPRL